MSLKYLTDIKAEACNLGFCAAGAATAEPVEKSHAERYIRMLENNGFADMDYLKKNVDKRLNPQLLFSGAQTVISFALNYTPSTYIDKNEYQIAAYAYGKDYHDVVKDKLRNVAENIGFKDYRIFCDTAPVLERYWAVKSGLGYICTNHQLIVPGTGSMVFLGEIITSESIVYDSQNVINVEEVQQRRCSLEKALCRYACPTKAFDEQGNFDATKCLSYQTIENHGEIPQDISSLMTNYIYGCDHCLKACPHNNGAPSGEEESFSPSKQLLEMKKEDWHCLSEETYRSLFKGSAVKRTKYSGLVRNIKYVSSNLS